MVAEKVYTWICLRYDKVGLVTADLKKGDKTVDTLGGSYPSWTPVRLDATQKWGLFPVHWEGYVIPE